MRLHEIKKRRTTLNGLSVRRAPSGDYQLTGTKGTANRWVVVMTGDEDECEDRRAQILSGDDPDFRVKPS